MKAIAPGKVILSGEHSVVYGAPAIAMAVTERIQADFLPTPSAGGLDFSIDIGEWLPLTLTLAQISALKTTLDHRYQRFELGDLPVSELLDTPSQLLFYALSHHHCLPAGCLTTHSTLPTGSGMGSSAAAIAATLVLAEQLTHTSRTLDERFKLVRHCERLQHGRGSAIDAAAVTYGGLVSVQNSQVSRLNCHLGEGWYRVNTGRPEVSTGECVEAVRVVHAKSEIWNEFADVTGQLPQVLDNSDRLINLLRSNHRLLQQIGVVPEAVAAFIHKVEGLGGAAKISGAGAHKGEHGGLVLLYLPDGNIHRLCETFGYTYSTLEEDTQGAHCISH